MSRKIIASAICGFLLCVGIAVLPVRYVFGMGTFERAISSALNVQYDSGSAKRIRWALRRDGEVTSRLRDLPPVSGVRCVQRLFPNGACCLVDFPDGRRSEIHIFPSGFYRFTVGKFTDPSFGMCRNPDFDPLADPGSPERMDFVRCDRL
jgi:hypothetical protein